jgi:hypothetical protein
VNVQETKLKVTTHLIYPLLDLGIAAMFPVAGILTSGLRHQPPLISGLIASFARQIDSSPANDAILPVLCFVANYHVAPQQAPQQIVLQFLMRLRKVRDDELFSQLIYARKRSMFLHWHIASPRSKLPLVRKRSALPLNR